MEQLYDVQKNTKHIYHQILSHPSYFVTTLLLWLMKTVLLKSNKWG